MKIIKFKSLNDALNECELTATIGAFDGIHLGHLELIKDLGGPLKKAVITFLPNPKAVFNRNFTYLQSFEQKIKILEKYIDFLFIIEFNDEFRNASKEAFINFLKINNIKYLSCGSDFSFGKNREGRPEDLIDFSVNIHNDVFIDGIKVSSSVIKELLINGNITKANNLLGRPYSFKEIVVHGSQLGRTIGFPTANIYPENMTIPQNGVYVSMTRINDKYYMSMTNIGKNPTFNMQHKTRIETYILDYDDDLYNTKIEVYFLDWIRNEKKFDSVADLKKELKRNVMTVRNYFAAHSIESLIND